MAPLRFVASNFEEIIAGIFMLVMTLTTCMNVILRYGFNNPLQWAEELSRYSFIWLTFIGAALATKHKRHIAIDSIVLVLPGRIRAFCYVLIDLIILGLTLVMIYYGMVLASSATQPTSTLKVPQYVVYFAVPFSALLIAAYTVGDLVKHTRALVAGEAL